MITVGNVMVGSGAGRKPLFIRDIPYLETVVVEPISIENGGLDKLHLFYSDQMILSNRMVARNRFSLLQAEILQLSIV